MQQKSVIIQSILVFIVAFFVYASSAGNRPFFTRGEGREALAVRSVVEDGQWVIPRRNEEIASKPPLFHWIAAVASSVNGSVNEFTVRLPSALFSALLLAVFFGFCNYFFSANISILALLILASSFEYARSSTNARVDMVFSTALFFSFCSLYSLYQAKCIKVVTMCVAIMSLSLSILAKGPAGGLIPIIVLGCFAFWNAQFSLVKLIKDARVYRIILVMVVSFVIGGLWYVAAYNTGGEEFFRRQIIGENVARLVPVEGIDVGHKKPFYFSVIYLIVSFLPWGLLIPLVVLPIKKFISKCSEDQSKFLNYNCLWCLMFVVAVSVSESKREVYFLPALPQLSLLVAVGLSELSKPSMLVNRFFTIIQTLAVFAVFAMLSVPFLQYVIAMFSGNLGFSIYTVYSWAYERIILWSVAWLFVFCVVLALILKAGAANIKKSFSVAGILLVVEFAVGHLVLPPLAEISDPSKFMAEVNKAVPANQAIYQFRNNFFAPAYYSTHPVRQFSFLEGINYVLVSESDYSELPEGSREVVIKSSSLAANEIDELLLVKLKLGAAG